MNVSEHFKLEELVHPDLIARLGDRAADWLHPMLGDTLESLKRNLGDTITVNNYLWDGPRIDSGLRLPMQQPIRDEVLFVVDQFKNEPDTLVRELVQLFKGIGAPYSAHRGGCAADCLFKNHHPVEVQTHIIKNQDKYPHITRLENAAITKTWLHLEVGQRRGRIYVFNP